MSHTATCDREDPGHRREHLPYGGAVGSGVAVLRGQPQSEEGPAQGSGSSGDRRRGPEPAPEQSAGASGRRWRARWIAGVRWMAGVPELWWAAVSAALFVPAVAAGAGRADPAVSWVLFGGCYLAGGLQPARDGLLALRRGVLDVDLLMVAAAAVAAAIGQRTDGGLLIVIFATSGALEALATRRTRDSVRSLLQLAPEQASVILADGTEALVDAASLAVGDRVVVRPGERIAADGLVVEGASDVDQASITGEGLPVARHPGDEVFAGTGNGTGTLVVVVLRSPSEFLVARIAALVDDASATKARAQLFIERVEQRYSMAMVAATVGLFAVPLALGAALQPTLLRAITFMIVASPCAVVLATMPPILSAIANAGRHGVLVKSAVAMEGLATVDVVCFDKTGTLTEGDPRVGEVTVVDGARFGVDEVLALAAGAESRSEHPLSRGLAAAAQARGLAVPEAVDFRAIPGRGVHARVRGHVVQVGSLAMLDAPARELEMRARQAVSSMEAHGQTAVVVVVDGAPVAVVGMVDQPRPAARSAVRALERLTGAPPVLLTGDNVGAARRLADEVGIVHVQAGLLPEDKVGAVRACQASGCAVLAVGDGVNDAPALAAADVGMAMGRRGSDLALDTADAVVVGDDLSAVPAAIGLSRRARRIMVQNLAFAALVMVALIVVDLAGHLPLPLGVAGHEGSTVIVGLNGLRLLRGKAWQPGRGGS